MNQQTRTGRLVVCLFLYAFVVWAALLLAQSLGGGLPDILANLTTALEHPFAIHWAEQSLVSILICSALYAAALCYLSANQGRTRDGAEHGSAAWGTPQQVNAMFAQKQNKLLTQNVRLGLDTHKHRRSLNVLVIGGSGAGKSRSYVVPNILEAKKDTSKKRRNKIIQCERKDRFAMSKARKSWIFQNGLSFQKFYAPEMQVSDKLPDTSLKDHRS